MAEERAPVFGTKDDLSDFQPKPKKTDVRAVAESAAFTSREPTQPRRAPRRYRTGRNQQLNLKVTASALHDFYALADRTGLVLGEVFERAVAALKRELGDWLSPQLPGQVSRALPASPGLQCPPSYCPRMR